LLLLCTGCGVLDLFSATFDIFAEPIHGVASGQSKGNEQDTDYGDHFFHGFSFQVNEQDEVSVSY